MLCPQILQLLRQLLFFLLPVRWEARSIKTDLEWSWMQPVVKYCYNSIVKAWNLLDLYCYTLLFTEISSKEVTCLFGHLVVSVYGAVLPKVVGPVWHGSPNICPSGYSEQERSESEYLVEVTQPATAAGWTGWLVERWAATGPEGLVVATCESGGSTPSIHPGGVDGRSRMLCERDMESLEVALATFNMAMARLTSWLLVQLGLQSSRDCGPCKPSRVRVQGEARTSGGCTNDDETNPQASRSVCVWLAQQIWGDHALSIQNRAARKWKARA
jgi:hypothetical protein